MEIIVKDNEKVMAVVGGEEFPIIEAGKTTAAKIGKAQEQLGKLVEYEAAMEEAKKILKPAVLVRKKANKVEPAEQATTIVSPNDGPALGASVTVSPSI